MKNCLLLLIKVFLTCQSLCSQNSSHARIVRVGYSTTAMTFKESNEFSVNFMGGAINSGPTFTGSGPEIAMGMNLSSKLYAEMGFSSFSGSDLRGRINNYERSSTLKGFHLPLTLNYLVRDSAKRLRVNLGGGVQYTKALMRQYEKIITNGVETVSQLQEVSVSEIFVVFRPGLQFRIIPRLFASFHVPVCVSFTGRYSDRPALSVSFTF